MLTYDEVIWGYRYILGREPETEAVVQASSMAASSVHEFRSALLRSSEFNRTYLRFPKPQWVAAPVFRGQRLMWLDLSDSYVSLACLHDDYEPVETQFIKAILNPDDTFVDIGANIGWFTLLASTIIGAGGAIHAYEPRQPIADYLSKSVALNGLTGTIAVHAAGLADREGKESLMWPVDSPNGGSASFGEGHALSNMMSQEIKIERLDQLGLPKLNVLKIDVEGAEFLAIRGGLTTIERCRPVILSEVYPSQLRRVSHIAVEQYLELFFQRGYRGFLIHHQKNGEEIKGWPEEWPLELLNVALIPEEIVPAVMSRWEPTAGR